MARPRTKRAAVAPEPLPPGVADFIRYKARKMAVQMEEASDRLADAERQVELLQYRQELEREARCRLLTQLAPRSQPADQARPAVRQRLSDEDVKVLGTLLRAQTEARRLGLIAADQQQ